MSTEPVFAIDCYALERRTIKNSLRRIFANTLPDAILTGTQPQRSAPELEAVYKTLAEGLLHSKERLEPSSTDTQKLDQTVTAVDTAALNKVRAFLDGLKHLYSLVAAFLTTGTRLIGKTLVQRLRRFKERVELSPRQPNTKKTGVGGLLKARIPVLSRCA